MHGNDDVRADALEQQLDLVVGPEALLTAAAGEPGTFAGHLELVRVSLDLLRRPLVLAPVVFVLCLSLVV
jgi:hypothetical protein